MADPSPTDEGRPSKRPLIVGGVCAGLGAVLGGFVGGQMAIGQAGSVLGAGMVAFIGFIVGWNLSRGGDE